MDTYSLFAGQFLPFAERYLPGGHNAAGMGRCFERGAVKRPDCLSDKLEVSK